MSTRQPLSHWQQHLAAAARSGEPLARYAASQDLSVQRLYAARHELKRRGGAVPALDTLGQSHFVPVRVLAPSVIVRMPNGLEVSLGGVSSSALPATLQLLARLSCGV